jgi:hypothetical protein
MPLFTWKCPNSQPPSDNHPVVFMHLSCDPKADWDPQKGVSRSFGVARMPWKKNVGTQLIASATRKDLSVDTVEAFSDFCQWHLGPFFLRYGADCQDAAATVHPSARVMVEITNAKWTDHLSLWKAEKEEAAAANTPRPHAYNPGNATSGLNRMGISKEDNDRIVWTLRDFPDTS